MITKKKLSEKISEASSATESLLLLQILIFIDSCSNIFEVQPQKSEEKAEFPYTVQLKLGIFWTYCVYPQGLHEKPQLSLIRRPALRLTPMGQNQSQSRINTKL